MRLLIGGSPCTHWSIAQTKNRETEASGIGWELFLNYRIARDKFQPDFFLYENNKSMSPSIRAQITAELGVEPVLINSALVSAQNRQRLYWVGKREPDGTYSQVPVEQPEDRGILLRDILETGVAWKEKSYTLDAHYYKSAGVYNPKKQHSYSRLMAAEPVRIGTIENDAKNQAFDSQQYRISHGFHEFSELHPRTDGKSNTLSTVLKDNPICEPVIEKDENGDYAISVADGKKYPVYEVRNGLISIKEKQYPIRLHDGFYIIRKLTVRECMRLQTVPETYIFPVSDSRAYKMLGNGWTVDVIAHIMSHFTGLTEEPMEVLSMYDGMGCGHIALDKLGVDIRRYHATEIDAYAIKTVQSNFPDVLQLGDAFQVRAEDWHLPEPAEMEAAEMEGKKDGN